MLHLPRRLRVTALTCLATAIAIVSAVGSASAAPTYRWYTPGGFAYVSSSQQGSNAANSYVLGYLLGPNFVGGRSDCAELDSARRYPASSTDNGVYYYGNLKPTTGCSPNAVGAWHAGTQCMWVQTTDPAGGVTMQQGALISSTASACSTKPGDDGGLWPSALFESGTYTGGSPAGNEAAIVSSCTDLNVYANYDPPTDNPRDLDGAESVWNASPGYLSGTTPIAGFMSRYRTANSREVLIKDTSRGNFTPWGFLNSTCVAGIQLDNPVVRTEGADQITYNSAAMHGTVHTNGLATAYKFDYGTTASYGSSTVVTNLGGSGSETAVSIPVSGLQPNTTYHYRLVATNAKGSSCSTSTSCGADGTFTTDPHPPAASPSGTRSNASGKQWQFYVGSDGQIWNWYWNGSTWTNARVGLGEAAAPNSSPSAVLASNGLQWVHYVGADGQIWGWFWNGTSWGNGHPGNGMAVKANTSPSAVREDSGAGRQWVHYIGTDGQIWKWYWDGSTWANGTLGSGQVAAPSSSPSAVLAGSGLQWVDYVGTDGQIWGWYWNGSSWGNGKPGVGQSVEPGTSPSVVREAASPNRQWIHYVGTDHQIWGWMWDGYTWGNGHPGSGQPVAPSSSPAGVRAASGLQWVHYIGSDNKVWGWYWDGYVWHNGHPGEGMTAAPYTSPGVVRDDTNSTGLQWATYAGSDGQIWGWYWDGYNWYNGLG